MLETSRDLLNLVIAFCILWFTIFLCWMIYYIALILKRTHEIIEKFTSTLEAVTGFFTSAKNKLSNFGSTINTAVEVGKRVAEYVEDKKEKKATSRKKKK